MGSYLSLTKPIIQSKELIQILMIGLDCGGKTSILYKIRLGEHIQRNDFYVDVVEYKNITFVSWDIGGSDKIRGKYCPEWRKHYKNTTHVIFVVDSNDRERVCWAKQEFAEVMQEEYLKDIPVLVFANKQDLPNHLTTDELVEQLELESILESKHWHIQPCCAISGDGLKEGFDWIFNDAIQNISRFKQAKSARS